MPDFSSFSMPLNIAIFAFSAAAVWFSGTKVAVYADELAERTGLGQALMGLLLLAGVTSLPEIATSFTAATSGDAPLAVNNLLGSVVLQVALLAFADFIYGKDALTSAAPDPIVMLQGTLNVCLLSFTAIAVLSGDTSFLGAGLWTWGLLIGSIYSLKKLTENKGRQPWIANISEDDKKERTDKRERLDDPMRRLLFKTAAMAAVILAAGAIVSLSGQAIADQSGLGSSFMGLAFVAIATSLPEASTVFAATRRGLYTMAISDILGTNILNVALIFGVDLISAGDPVLNVVGNFAAVGALLGAATTGLFLMGLAERRDTAFFRMGVDSILVIATYAGGLILLYSMRGGA